MGVVCSLAKPPLDKTQDIPWTNHQLIAGQHTNTNKSYPNPKPTSQRMSLVWVRKPK